jgi:hypothetical protein
MKRTLLVTALGLGCLTAVQAQNLLNNGSFETCLAGYEPQPMWGFVLSYPGLPGGTTGLPGWNINLGNWTELYWYMGNGGSGGSAQEGTRFLNLTSGGNPTESISQSFGVTAGLSYQVSYYERERDAGATLASAITLDAGTATGTLSQIANAGADWTIFSYSFLPDTTTTATLRFAQAAGTANGVYLDNISVTAVPEPTSAAVFALGGLLLALRRRK